MPSGHIAQRSDRYPGPPPPTTTRATGLIPALCLVACTAGFPIPAAAHETDNTHVQITVSGETFEIEISNDPDWLWRRLSPPGAPLPDEAQRARDLTGLTGRLVDEVGIFFDGAPAVIERSGYAAPRSHDPTAPVELAAPGIFRLAGAVPGGASRVEFAYSLVTGQYPLTLTAGDAPPVTRWMLPGERSGAFRLDRLTPMTSGQVVAEYLRLGYTHILPHGLDHILFVLGIVLLSTKVRPMVIQVTAFTVAHTLTLGLTMLGAVSAPSSVVEPLIALSITYVAIENLTTRRLHPWRVALVFGFGLLHGMGFAGVLTGLDLPRTELVTALLSFNLGVEAGQLSVIALAGGVLFHASRQAWYRRRVVVPASCAMALTGLVWALDRITGYG